MKHTQLIIALLVTHILLQEKITTDSKTESAPQLQKAFELLLQVSQDLAPTNPEKLKFNQPIDAGLAVTWIDDEVGEACSISLDKIDEHTSIVMLSHARPDSLKDSNYDTEVTKKLALIRHITHFLDLKKAFVNKLEAQSGLSSPLKKSP